MNSKIDFILAFDKEKKLFKIDFFKFTSNKFEKSLNLLLYYLNIPKGHDLIYPELGIDMKIWTQDKMIIIRELEQLIYNLNSYFNINARLISIEIDEVNKAINIYIEINQKQIKIDVNKPDITEHYDIVY